MLDRSHGRHIWPLATDAPSTMIAPKLLCLDLSSDASCAIIHVVMGEDRPCANWRSPVTARARLDMPGMVAAPQTHRLSLLLHGRTQLHGPTTSRSGNYGPLAPSSAGAVSQTRRAS